MSIKQRLSRADAENLLLHYGARNKREQTWTKQQLFYLEQNGRRLFALCSLSREEFLNLTFNGTPDETKVASFEDVIKKGGLFSTSYLFLRDLNSGESGSYYVENGIHRVMALQNIVKSGEEAYKPVKAIIVSRSSLVE